jgi:small-conductance mechanosensitive channel
MTKPGNQWPVRSKVYAEIRALFEREGIRFASREVRVRVTDRDDLDPETQRTIAGAAAQLALGQQQKTVTDETR